MLFGEQDEMEKLKDFLTYNGIRKSKLSFDEAEQVYELFVDDKRGKQAKTIAGYSGTAGKRADGKCC